MQSSLFGNTDTQSAERFSLQGHKMLRAQLGGNHPPEFLARKGSMIAYQGAVDFDGNPQTYGEQYAAGATGEQLNLMRCHGQGVVYLANLAQDLHVIDLDYQGLTVDGQYVLALDSMLTWNVVAVDTQQGIAGVGDYNLEISGSGKLVLMTSGAPLVMRCTMQNEVFADADAVVAWSTNLSTRMEAQVTSQRVYSRRRGTGEGWNMSFMGDGYVVVQPSELLPPVEFLSSNNWLANRGLGQQGVQGNTWGS